MDGNITRKGNTYYYWSADGLLDSVIAGTTKLRYEYDATGRLVRKSRNGTVQRHLMWDDLQLLAELNATAKERVGEYVYLPGIDRPMMLVTGETSVTNKFQLVLDQIGNVIGAVNDGSYSMRYDPWGRRSQETGTLAAVNRLTWKGLFWEGDSTRLYYARNRWYDPDVGRFVTEDPLGLSSGINLYVFYEKGCFCKAQRGGPLSLTAMFARAAVVLTVHSSTHWPAASIAYSWLVRSPRSNPTVTFGNSSL